jgi:hypothetical protein
MGSMSTERRAKRLISTVYPDEATLIGAATGYDMDPGPAPRMRRDSTFLGDVAAGTPIGLRTPFEHGRSNKENHLRHGLTTAITAGVVGGLLTPLAVGLGRGIFRSHSGSFVGKVKDSLMGAVEPYRNIIRGRAYAKQWRRLGNEEVDRLVFSPSQMAEQGAIEGKRWNPPSEESQRIDRLLSPRDADVPLDHMVYRRGEDPKIHELIDSIQGNLNAAVRRGLGEVSAGFVGASALAGNEYRRGMRAKRPRKSDQPK